MTPRAKYDQYGMYHPDDQQAFPVHWVNMGQSCGFAEVAADDADLACPQVIIHMNCYLAASNPEDLTLSKAACHESLQQLSGTGLASPLALLAGRGCSIHPRHDASAWQI